MTEEPPRQPWRRLADRLGGSSGPLVALALWLALALPLALGERTLCLRDVFATHLHFKAFGATQLGEGTIPAFNPTWGLGQVFRGNPNALAFYPGNLLYLLLPFWSAFNLHFALHWLLAAVAAYVLARALGLSDLGAQVTSLTWAGCGWMLSTLSFYNVLTVAAWWPLALWGGIRGGRRGIALGGLCCGLAVLGGEPVTLALGMVPLFGLAIARQGARRGIGAAAAILGVGALAALPQLVATLRVVGFTFRGAHGLPPGGGIYAFHPARLLELLVPYPFGLPVSLGAEGFWATGIASRIPWVFTLHLGAVGAWLLPWGVRRRPGWSVLAAGGLLAAWLVSAQAGLVEQLSAGLVRYPEKLLFWFALGAAIVAGAGADRLLESPQRPSRWALGGSIAALSLAVSFLLPEGPRQWLARSMGASSASHALDAQVALWLGSLTWVGSVLLVSSVAIRRWPRALPLLQVASLLPLAPLVVTDETAAYRRPADWAATLPAESAVVPGTFDPMLGNPPASYRGAGSSIPARLRLAAADLDASPGVLFGLTYPLAPDLEGMHTPFSELLLLNLPRLPWEVKERWLRVVGAEALVVPVSPGVPGRRPDAVRDSAGERIGLYRLDGAAPRAWWPERLGVVDGPLAALQRVSATPDPLADVSVPWAVPHVADARVEVRRWSPDRIDVAVDGAGGLLVVRRAYHPLWRARAGETELRVLPADLLLLGVEVPAGRKLVRLDVDSRPEGVALACSWLTLLAALVVGWRR